MTASAPQARAEIVHERAKALGRGASNDSVTRLERFAQDALDRKPPAVRFELLQYIAGEGNSRVKVIDASASALDIAHTAFEFAHHDAQAFAGVTTYGLVAYAEGSEAYGERCTFKIAARMVDNIAPSESPTSAGLQLQAMRHMEVMAFQYSEGMRNVLREKDLTIGDLRADNTKLREERTMLIDSQMKVIRLRENLSSEETDRQLTIERERASMAQKDKLASTFFSIAVPILQKKLAAWQGVAAVTPPAVATAAPAAEAVADATPPATSAAKGKSKDVAPAVITSAAVAPAPAAPPKPRLSTEACERVVEWVTSLDEPTFAKVIGVLSDEQGGKLLALAAQLHADVKSEAT